MNSHLASPAEGELPPVHTHECVCVCLGVCVCEMKPGLGVTFTPPSPALSALRRTGTVLPLLQPQGFVRAWYAFWDAGPRPAGSWAARKAQAGPARVNGPHGHQQLCWTSPVAQCAPWTGSCGSSDKRQPRGAAAPEPRVELALSTPQRLGVELSFSGGNNWRRIKFEPALRVVGAQSRTGGSGATSRRRRLWAGAGLVGRQRSPRGRGQQ